MTTKFLSNMVKENINSIALFNLYSETWIKEYLSSVAFYFIALNIDYQRFIQS